MDRLTQMITIDFMVVEMRDEDRNACDTKQKQVTMELEQSLKE